MVCLAGVKICLFGFGSDGTDDFKIWKEIDIDVVEDHIYILV